VVVVVAGPEVDVVVLPATVVVGIATTSSFSAGPGADSATTVTNTAAGAHSGETGRVGRGPPPPDFW
jgi:hypothetical protein